MSTGTKNRKTSRTGRIFIGIAWVIISLLFPIGMMAQIRVFDAPAGVALNNDFTVQVRPAGQKQWQGAAAYNIMVAKMENGKKTEENASLAYFSTAGKVEVAVRLNKGSLQTCLLYTSPSPRDRQKSRMPSSA